MTQSRSTGGKVKERNGPWWDSNPHYFGIQKDGTSRNKRKILTTSISTPDGQMPLGFSQTARETGIAIAQHVIDQLKELSIISNISEEELAGRYIFNMSDRAANEGVADRELSMWKSQVTGDPDSEILSFHCTAHVLLGFSSYIGKSLTSHFIVTESSVHHLIRLASDLLGPVADERNGIQDKWRSFCYLHHKKSRLISFKDNRFNALFQQSALLIQHMSDIATFLSQLNSSNFKVATLQTHLADHQTQIVLNALALLYIMVTEPFCRLATSTSNSVSYLNLFSYIQPLFTNISSWVQRPKILLDLPCSIPDFEPDRLCPLYQAVVTSCHQVDRAALCTVLTVLSAVQSCIKKQLVNFLPGGRFASAPCATEVSQTAGSSLNNLACERDFGSLDFSMKCRRHASLHYHTSHLMLKSNIASLAAWLSLKPPHEQIKLWQVGKTKGKDIRLKQKKQKQKTMEESFNITETPQKAACLVQKTPQKAASHVQNPPPPKAASHVQKTPQKAASLVQKTPQKTPEATLPDQQLQIQESQFVAVAYDNCWYSGENNDIISCIQTLMHCGIVLKSPCYSPLTVFYRPLFLHMNLIPHVPVSLSFFTCCS